MVRAGNSSTLETAASGSRRAGRPSCRQNREGQLPWRRSLRRTRRNIDSSERLLDSSRRVIEVSERCAARRPLRASRQLQRVAGWLAAAEARLQRAVHGLRATADDAARAPERAAEAPGKLNDATARWINTAAQLAALSERMDDASSRLLAAAKIGAVSFDLPGPGNHSGQAAAAPRLITLRRLRERRLTPDSGRIRYISIWRQRSRPAAFAEAVRRTFRGRAPPHAAICSL